MHWIQNIRKTLALSQRELAQYLQLSTHTIKSVERDRRQLPLDTLPAALSLFNAINDARKHPIEEPTSMANPLGYRMIERQRRRCCRKLDVCNFKLGEMQKTFSTACARLRVYQSLVQLLESAGDAKDSDRLQWLQWKIAEASLQVDQSNAHAQLLLKVEIAGLESEMQALEENYAKNSGPA